mmetsp:Transcript_9380/g.12941  ORF Transcript_9380/g.12941 Transcript_9380/m.12941 type:complete len:329 (+) Transcript_9380:192-1178(+)
MESSVQSQELVAQLASIFETIPAPQIEDLIRSYEGTHTLDFYVDKILEKTIAEATLSQEEQTSEIQSSQPAETTDELVSTFEIVTPETEVHLPEIQVEDVPIPSPITEHEPIEEPLENPADLKAALKRIKKLEKQLKRTEKEKKKALNWAVAQVETMKTQVANRDKAILEKDEIIQQQQQRIQTLIDERAAVENNVFHILKTTADKIKDGGNALVRGVDVQLDKLEKELPSGNAILNTIKSLLSDIAEGSKRFSVAANEKFTKMKEEFDVTKASMQSYIDELQLRLQRYQEQEESAAPINMNNVEASTQAEQPTTDKASQTSTTTPQV